MYLVGAVYNFCTCHKSLRLLQPDGPRKWLTRTPAMAANITDHRWTIEELMGYRAPPPPLLVPRKRGRRQKPTCQPIYAQCPT